MLDIIGNLEEDLNLLFYRYSGSILRIMLDIIGKFENLMGSILKILAKLLHMQLVIVAYEFL